jgi:hypothetical protein
MSGVNYSKNLVKVPMREVAAGLNVKGRTNPTLTYMSNELVQGSNIYIEMGWIWAMPEPNPHIFGHSHDDYNEVVFHIGADPQNPEYLGAEIEFVVGNQPLTIDKTSAIFVPKGVKHGPLTWKKVERPHLQMAIVLGAGNLDEANPGGHQ